MKESIKYGYCFWYEDGEFSSIPDQVKDFGFDYAEVGLIYPWPDEIHNNDIQLTKEKLENLGVKYAFHSPLEGLLLFNPRDGIVQAALDVHKRCLKFSAEFEPLYYNLHVKADAMTLMIKSRDLALQKCLQALDELNMLADELGIRLVVENSSSTGYLVPLNELFSIGIGFTLDIGHWFKGGNDYRELDSLVNKLGKHLVLLHLHDVSFDDRGVDHLSLGRGNIDFTKVFHILKHSGVKWITIETFPSTNRKLTVPEDLSKTKKLVNLFVRTNTHGDL